MNCDSKRAKTWFGFELCNGYTWKIHSISFTVSF